VYHDRKFKNPPGITVKKKAAQAISKSKSEMLVELAANSITAYTASSIYTPQSA
jgi:hypothetical protein